jgi:hypothetical protein
MGVMGFLLGRTLPPASIIDAHPAPIATAVTPVYRTFTEIAFITVSDGLVCWI